jgi:integrase
LPDEPGWYYIPEAAPAVKTLFSDFASDWLGSLTTDPAAMTRHESVYRLHVCPAFGRRRVRVIRPSHVHGWLAELSERYGPATVAVAFAILRGVLDLAVAAHAIDKNPARSVAVRMPRYLETDMAVWDDAAVAAAIAAHREDLRLAPELAASCGLREAEVFGLALEDFDFEEQIVRVRRQLARAGRAFVFAPPEQGRQRVIPLPEWGAAQVREHIGRFPPQPRTLPWRQPDGEPHTCHLLLRRPARRSTSFDQLRHYYASVMLAGGVSIGELAEYLGADPVATLRAYAHLLPSAHGRARAAVDTRFGR